MTFLNTHESHVVGIGSSFQEKEGTYDYASWLPLTQGFSFSVSKSLNRLKHVHGSSYDFNRQTLYAIPEISLFTLDNSLHSGNQYDWFEKVGITTARTGAEITGYYPLLQQLYTGSSGADGRNIYFITDTGERARDQIPDNSFDRQLFVIENSFLSNISWNMNANTLGSLQLSYIGTDFVSGSWTGNLTGINLSNETRTQTLNISGIQDFATGTDLVITSTNSIFVGQNTTVSGAPDFGTIRGISWSIDLDREQVFGLGNKP